MSRENRIFIAVEVDEDVKLAMERLKDRDGVALRFHLDKALRRYLTDSGIRAGKAGVKKARTK